MAKAMTRAEVIAMNKKHEAKRKASKVKKADKSTEKTSLAGVKSMREIHKDLFEKEKNKKRKMAKKN